MNVVQVAIPQYDRRTGLGNYNPGRGGVVPDSFIIHWMDGTLASTDAVFRSLRLPNGKPVVRSAQFGIEDYNVHQYVSLHDTSFGAGVYSWNQRGINIELSAQPGRDATDATYESTCQTVVSSARFYGKNVSDFQFKRHGEIVPTQCCGTVDVDRIRNRALEIESSLGSSQEVLASVKVPVTGFWIMLDAAVNVREQPSTSSPIYATYPKGSVIECDGTVTGQIVNGKSAWYHTQLHGKFVSAAYSHVINQPANSQQS